MVWRVSSLYTVAYALVAVLVGLTFTAFDLYSWATVVQRGSTLLYILARLAITVEAFRSLFFLPPSTFNSAWTTNFPHFVENFCHGVRQPPGCPPLRPCGVDDQLRREHADQHPNWLPQELQKDGWMP